MKNVKTGYKPAYEDEEWLKDYCRTMRSIVLNPNAAQVEKKEARMKLTATIDDARKRGIQIYPEII